jgi:dTMP kinase
MTLLVEAAPDIAAARLGGRGGVTDRIEARDAAFHARVATAFAEFAQAEPARFRRIDANGTPEATHQAVLAALDLLP